jgi:hypothetical protein
MRPLKDAIDKLDDEEEEAYFFWHIPSQYGLVKI